MKRKEDTEAKLQKENFEKISYAIGKFILSFEEIMLHIRICIQNLIKRHGISNQNFVDVMLADMQADELQKRLDGLLAITFPDEMNDTETKTMLKKLYDGLTDAIKFRNKIAHAHWHILHTIGLGPNRDELDSRLVATGKRIKRFKGAQPNFPNVDFTYINELLNIAERNRKLTSKLGELSINITSNKPLKTKWHS